MQLKLAQSSSAGLHIRAWPPCRFSWLHQMWLGCSCRYSFTCSSLYSVPDGIFLHKILSAHGTPGSPPSPVALHVRHVRKGVQVPTASCRPSLLCSWQNRLARFALEIRYFVVGRFCPLSSCWHPTCSTPDSSCQRCPTCSYVARPLWVHADGVLRP